MSDRRLESVDVILPLEKSEDESAWRAAAADALGVDPERIGGIRLRKHSIDARQRRIKVQLRLEIAIDGSLPGESAPQPDFPQVPPGARRVAIVGCGPAGMFAALRCLETGLKPVILERGKDASARRFDLASVMRHGTVIEDSNYCFGEGGAGTFSDGKLYTRAKKRGPVARVYEILVAHGAPQRILVDSHPHIGSNLLPNVVKAIRESILEAGGEVHFGARVEELLLESSGIKPRVRGVATADGREFAADAVILATGHSARDVYHLLERQDVRMEAKAFALGVRIEHPQALVDSLQYHCPRTAPRPPLLPAASYRLATKIEGRGVHSFCMCPGGLIVPTATENDEIVVNGMSLSKRDSPFANSGMVVGVEPEDAREFEEAHGVLSGVAFQKQLERAAKKAGGGGQTAPAQRLTDFLAGADTSELPDTSYHPGIRPARLDGLLPRGIVDRLRAGLKLFGRQTPGYVTEEAILVGVESRTSSPVRVPRDPETLQHPEVDGLFPCGEGAGYAGGIVSAALDGIRSASAVAGADITDP